MHRAFERVPLLLLSALALVGLLSVALRAYFEWQGILHTDVAIFLTVARGMLNGLRPYVDLFETKAPGIFILSAWSLRFFGDARLLSGLQAVTTVLFPLTLALPVWLRLRDRALALAAFAGGSVLALYAAESGGHVYVESVAAFFACALTGIVFAGTGRLNLWQSVGVGSCVLIAAGLKEPFVLSIVSALVLLAPDRTRLTSLMIPVAGAAVAGLLALMVLGLLQPFFSEYLAHMFGDHIGNAWGTANVPWWIRTIDLPRVAVQLRNTSPFVLALVAACWMGALVCLLRRATGRNATIMAFGRWFIATWLSTSAIGAGGDFYTHHFLFAVPLYAACMLVCLRCWHGIRSFRIRTVITVAMGCVALASLITIPNWSSDATPVWRSEWLEPRMHAAAALDRAMDRCGIDRYMNFIDRPDGVYGFTRHSPYGPIFQAYGRFGGLQPGFLEGYAAAISESPLLIMKEGESQPMLDKDTSQYLRESFSETPWDCVGEFTQPAPYHLFFRTPVSQ